MSRFTGSTPGRRSRRPSATSGRCRCGTATVARPAGAHRRGGRWACSTPSDWRAQWIEPGLPEDAATSPPAPMLRRAFRLEKAVRSARAYVTSHGLYEMQLNGTRVGDDVLTPGWTTLQQAAAVPDLRRHAAPAARRQRGRRRPRQRLVPRQHRLREAAQHYGDRLALLLQIDVTYADGSARVDHERRAVEGGDRTDPHVRDLQRRDLRRAAREGGLGRARLRRRKRGRAVRVAEFPKDTLIAPAGPPVRRIEEIKPKEILTTPAGQTVVDMGQNMVGWVRLRVEGPAGTTVTLRHAEVLDKDGNFYTANLRTAQQTTTYTLKGGGAGDLRAALHLPRLPLRAGRRLSRPSSRPRSLTGIVVHSAMAPTGEFATSHPLLNQLQHNILWGQKGNFVDVPTDCPQRDERLGWTGDAQVFARTAAFNMDVAGLLHEVAEGRRRRPVAERQRAVRDSRRAQPAEQASCGSAGWADAAVIIPWTMYLMYGDTRVLEEQYPSMARWVEYMRERAGDDYIWNGRLPLRRLARVRDDAVRLSGRDDGQGPDRHGVLRALDRSARAHRAACSARPRTPRNTSSCSRRSRQRSVREFVTPAGRVGEDTQTAYVLALQFDLLPERAPGAGGAAARAGRRERKHLTTGFLGTPYLLRRAQPLRPPRRGVPAARTGEYPSWLYPVTKGATTIWERWDGIKPDGSFQDAGMNSFNHYAYGAIGDWMYSRVAGLDVDEARAGLQARDHRAAPRRHADERQRAARIDVRSGRVGVAGEGRPFPLVRRGAAECHGHGVPAARAVIDGATEGGQPLQQAPGVSVKTEAGVTRIEIGSGRVRLRNGLALTPEWVTLLSTRAARRRSSARDGAIVDLFRSPLGGDRDQQSLRTVVGPGAPASAAPRRTRSPPPRCRARPAGRLVDRPWRAAEQRLLRPRRGACTQWPSSWPIVKRRARRPLARLAGVDPDLAAGGEEQARQRLARRERAARPAPRSCPRRRGPAGRSRCRRCPRPARAASRRPRSRTGPARAPPSARCSISPIMPKAMLVLEPEQQDE